MRPLESRAAEGAETVSTSDSEITMNASNAVADNVEKVAQMTEETSAAGHTLRDAADGLSQLAASLRQTVGRFQL